MSEFSSKWASWDSETPNQGSATSAASTPSKANGTSGTTSSAQFQKIKAISDDDLAQGFAYVLVKRIAEFEAVKEVEAAWATLTPQEIVQFPDAALKHLKAIPVEDPAQIMRWRDDFLKSIEETRTR